MSKKAIESWARADLVKEIHRLQDELDLAAKRLGEAAEREKRLRDELAAVGKVPAVVTEGKARGGAPAHDGVEYGNTYVRFPNVFGIHETDRALKVRFTDGEERWIPKSAIHADSEVYEGDGTLGDLIVARWFCEKEGLI